MKAFLLAVFLLLAAGVAASPADSTGTNKSNGFQIHLQYPAKEIKFIMYEKNFLPIRGELSEDKKEIIMPEYQPGNKVRVKVVYEDGSAEEFVRSPCYIDPVVL